MKMQKKIIISFLTLLNFTGNSILSKNSPDFSYRSIGQKQDSVHGNVICICMPKCGTHLLLKCLSLFNIPGIKYAYKHEYKLIPAVRELNKHYPPHHYKGRFHVPTNGPLPRVLIDQMAAKTNNRSFWSHWTYTAECEEYLSEHSYANFFILRDPRDQVVSMAHMVQKGFEPGQDAPLDKLILDLIDGRQQHFILWGVEKNGVHPLEWELGVGPFYELYLPWMNAPKFFTIRFEDLVGPMGGGSLEKQLETIQCIASHIGHPISDQKAIKISEDLFGNGSTFREGQIGSWKKYFTPEMIDAFKKSPAGKLLITLGYEKDLNW